MAQSIRKTYSLAQKVALVAEVDRLYRGGGRTYTSIAQELGINDASYHSWVRQGVKAALPPASPTTRLPYAPADREVLLAEVDRLRGLGQSIHAACRASGISEKSYRTWRDVAAPLAPMRPVEVTGSMPSTTMALALVPPRPAPIAAAFALVAPGGYRIEGLSVEAAAQLLKALS